MNEQSLLKPSDLIPTDQSASQSWSELIIKSNQSGFLQWENEKPIPPVITHDLSWGRRYRHEHRPPTIEGDFLPGEIRHAFSPLRLNQGDIPAMTEESVFRAASMLRQMGGQRVFRLEAEQFNTVLELPDGTIFQKQKTWYRAQIVIHWPDGRDAWTRWGGTQIPRISEWVSMAETILNDPLRRLPVSRPENGNVPVLLAPGWSGMLFHEAIGHSLEADTIQSGNSWLSGLQNGNQLAPHFFNLTDWGTNPAGRGFEPFDDEGTPVQDTVLVNNGIWTGLLHNRTTAQLFPQQQPAGNARCVHAFHPPLVRMRNLCVLPGPHQPDDLLRSVKNGIFIRDLGGGIVDGHSGQFHFPVEHAYRIKNGKLISQLSPFTIEGSGPDVLMAVDGVGTDFYLDPSAGWCEKSDQSVPVSIGQPTILLSSLKVIT